MCHIHHLTKYKDIDLINLEITEGQLLNGQELAIEGSGRGEVVNPVRIRPAECPEQRISRQLNVSISGFVSISNSQLARSSARRKKRGRIRDKFRERIKEQPKLDRIMI